jgi:hypothetical protein
MRANYYFLKILLSIFIIVNIIIIYFNIKCFKKKVIEKFCGFKLKKGWINYWMRLGARISKL